MEFTINTVEQRIEEEKARLDKQLAEAEAILQRRGLGSDLTKSIPEWRTQCEQKSYIHTQLYNLYEAIPKMAADLIRADMQDHASEFSDLRPAIEIRVEELRIEVTTAYNELRTLESLCCHQEDRYGKCTVCQKQIK